MKEGRAELGLGVVDGAWQGGGWEQEPQAIYGPRVCVACRQEPVSRRGHPHNLGPASALYEAASILL